MWFLLLGLIVVVAGFVIPTRIRWQSAPSFVRAMRNRPGEVISLVLGTILVLTGVVVLVS